MTENSNVRMANNAELKMVVKALGDAANLVSELVKGFSFSEISEGYALSQEVKEIMKNPTILLPEWEKLDDEARNDLKAYAAANVKIPANMSVEGYLEKVLASAIALSAVVAPWLA